MVTFQVGANAGDSLSATFSNIEGSGGLGGLGYSWGAAATGGTVIDLSQSSALTSLTDAISATTAANASALAITDRRFRFTNFPMRYRNVSGRASSGWPLK